MAPARTDGREVDRALERVGLLAAGDLEDDRADVGAGRGLEGGAGHVEGLGAQVDRRDGEARHLAAAAGRVQVLDAGALRAEGLARLPDDPLGGRGRRVIRRERRGPGEVADGGRAERRLVVDDEDVAVEMGGRTDGREQVGGRGRDVGHRRGVSLVVVRRHGTARETPRPATAASTGQICGFTTIRNTIVTRSDPHPDPAELDAPDQCHELRRRAARAGRGRRRRDLDDAMDVLALHEEPVPVDDRVQDDPQREPPMRPFERVDPRRPRSSRGR